MTLAIVPFVLGFVDNNTYLVADEATGKAVIIDPSFESEQVLLEAERRGWDVKEIWITHAHFDHFAGIGIAYKHNPPLIVGMHPEDILNYHTQTGGNMFGLKIAKGPEPSLFFQHGQKIPIGEEILEVRHAPGHSPGHVIFYSESANTAFVGDVIFYRGIGRTDFPGCSFELLMDSIYRQVFTLPDNTVLLPGHGPDTTVEAEKRYNPFV